MKLTKQGREFNAYVSQALDLIDKAVDVAHEQAGAPSGNFDLGVIYTIQDQYLPRLLRGFRAKYGQNIRISTYQGLTESLVDDLVAGRYDVVFGSDNESFGFHSEKEWFDFLKESNAHTMPILLLDDIFDKLDAARVEKIVQLVSGDGFGQIFITDTNRDHLDQILQMSNADYRLFLVNDGEISSKS